MSALPIQNTTVEDGFIIDIETGEILGLAELPKPQFTVSDRDSFDWVLNRIAEADATVASIGQTPAVIHAKAILANAEAMEKQAKKKADWLRARFSPELGEYAKRELFGQKVRTLKSVYGSVGLRTVKGGLRVADESAAIEWAKQNGLDEAVQLKESFRISALPTDIKSNPAAFMGIDSPLANRAFDIKPDEEKVDVKTGVVNAQLG